MSILLVGKKIVVYDVTTSSIGLVIFQGICAFFFFLRYLKSWKIGGSEGHTFVTWGQGKSVSASLTDLPRALVDDGMKGFSRVSKIALLFLFGGFFDRLSFEASSSSSSCHGTISLRPREMGRVSIFG